MEATDYQDLMIKAMQKREEEEKNLTVIDQIRKRPGMYLGEFSIVGFKNILSYFFNEIQSNNVLRTEILVEFLANGFIKIEAKNVDTFDYAEILWSGFPNKLFSSQNKKSDYFFGLQVVVALSKEVKIEVQTPTDFILLNAKKGVFEVKSSAIKSAESSINIEFELDYDIWRKDFSINYEVINDFIRKYALINNDYRIKSIDNRAENTQIAIFDYPNGLSHQLDYLIGTHTYHGGIFMRMDLKTKTDKHQFEICFAYLDCWVSKPSISTYANNDKLIFGGSLEKGIIEGIVLAVKKLAKEKNAPIDINYKKAQPQLLLIASIKGDKFDFTGSVKAKINMPEVCKTIKGFVSEQTYLFFSQNEDVAKMMLKHFQKY